MAESIIPVRDEIKTYTVNDVTNVLNGLTPTSGSIIITGKVVAFTLTFWTSSSELSPGDNIPLFTFPNGIRPINNTRINVFCPTPFAQSSVNTIMTSAEIVGNNGNAVCINGWNFRMPANTPIIFYGTFIMQ